VPAQLVPGSGRWVHREEAGSKKADADDEEQGGPSPCRPSLAKLGGDAMREHEEQHAEHDEVDLLNPAPWPKGKLADKHPACIVAGAKPALDREYGHEEGRPDHARPGCQ